MLATLLPGVVLLVAGLLLLWNPPFLEKQAMRFLRSKPAAIVTFGSGTLWFLYHLSNLGMADFGAYRLPLMVLFGATGVAAFFYVEDFLPVRGLAVLALLSSAVLLNAAYMRYDEPQRLFMVGFVYVMILVALYLGALPYRLRDFFEWLWKGSGKARVLGLVLGGYGLLLTCVAFTY